MGPKSTVNTNFQKSCKENERIKDGPSATEEFCWSSTVPDEQYQDAPLVFWSQSQN